MTAGVELSCSLRRGAFELNVDAGLGSRSTGLFGRSGSGKTSLLLALSGLLPAQHLRLVVDGDVIVDSSSGLVPPAHRRRVGLVFQDHRLFPHRTARQNLVYGARAGGDSPPFDEVVDLLDVRPLLGRRPAQCSGGERQRIAIGRALLAGPRLLCLDEPLASLDRGLKRQILPYLRRIRDRYGLPMLVVSHDLGDLLALTDELLLVDAGRAIGQGAPWELAQHAGTLDLLHDCGLVFALVGDVARRDDGEGVTWVSLGGGAQLGCGGECEAPVGARVEALVRPEDVILALPPLEARLSLTNALRGHVQSITRTEARCLVTIDAGLGSPVLAEVTERAIRRLGLAPGTEVIALVKAQAIRTRALG